MTLLFKLISKIKNEILMTIIMYILSLLMLGCLVGFFALPFIVYSEVVKLTFLLIWIICAIEFFLEMILSSARQIKFNKKEKEKYQKDKIVYWFTLISSELSFTFTFLLVFLKRNFNLPINIYDILFFFICFLVISALISNLLSMYKNKYGKMLRDGAITVLCLFSVLCVAIGIKAYQEDSIASKILIAFGAIVLLVVCIKLVFNVLLSIEKIDTVSSSIIIFIGIGVLGGILLRYVITDCKLQEILTTIFAAIVGGAITLGGVAWTINKSDSNRKEDDKKKYRPVVNLISTSQVKNLKGTFINKTYFDGVKENLFEISEKRQTKYTIENCILRNTKFTEFYYSGLMINNDKFYLFSKMFIDIDGHFGINAKDPIYYEEGIDSLALIMHDLLGNEYKLPIKFYVSGDDEFNIEIKDVGFVCDINVDKDDEKF